MDIHRIGPQGKPEGGAQENQHTVAGGDTLDSIAKQYGIQPQSILEANPQIKDPAQLQPGLILTIPQSGEKLAANLFPGIDPAKDFIEQAPSQPDIFKRLLGESPEAIIPTNPCMLPESPEASALPAFSPKIPESGEGLLLPCIIPESGEGLLLPCIMPESGEGSLIACVKPGPESMAAEGNIVPGSMTEAPVALSNDFRLTPDLFQLDESGQLLIKDLLLATHFKGPHAEGPESKEIIIVNSKPGEATASSEKLAGFKLTPDLFEFSDDGFLIIKDLRISNELNQQAENVAGEKSIIVV